MYLCIHKGKMSGMNKIKEVLETKWLSQTELAGLLGKSFNMVNLYATNKIQPPIPVLYQIADILNIDVRDLLVPNQIQRAITIWRKMRLKQTFGFMNYYKKPIFI